MLSKHPRAQAFLGNTFHTFGAVEVSGQNLYRLLRQKEAVLLFPGGVREAFKRKGEKYRCVWGVCVPRMDGYVWVAL
jgi:hypothetical protein